MMISGEKQNANPVVRSDSSAPRRKCTLSVPNEDSDEEIDSLEIFDMIRDINDPEHPLTLEALNVLAVYFVVTLFDKLSRSHFF
jgi:hypothetical protein